ncbi:MAG: NADH-quinone oxidoreductase subunit L [Phycisphaerae bacterium]|nr:NADH-quinone oxidoreductase subunit L [Phycisphaerae bacterium]
MHEGWHYTCLIPLLPLLGAALVGVFLRVLRGQAHWPVILGVGGAFVVSMVVWLGGGHGHGDTEHATSLIVNVYQWFPTGEGAIGSAKAFFNVLFLIDPLTIVMLLTVTGVSTLVVIYSVGYMREHDGHPERGYERFFAFMGLFVFSMCSLVLAGNFLLLYLGWEAVGLCSYLLIGFYYQRPSAAAAAKKAFLVNRIGDFGFGLGVLLIYLTYGALDYATVFEATRVALEHDMTMPDKLAILGQLDIAAPAELIRTLEHSSRLTWIALLLFCGAVGKSAQLPLYVWLPDAMEGPSPVSALIHAATMVTAGVYMVARCGIIFAHSETAMIVVAWTGGLTALFSATIALAQYDLKRILAYSTVSQLGYMFLALGVAAPAAAIFHLHTHAFFKGLLFLAAGSVMHAMAGVIDVRKLGGLSKQMPITCLTFWIGGLALAGFPLLSGFWSKDEIVAAALHANTPLGIMAVVTAVMTAFYTFRAIFLTFHGEPRLPEGAHPHEQPRVMTGPLCVLAVGAALAGYWNIAGHFGHFLAPSLTVLHGGEHGHDYPVMVMSGLLAIAGILAAYVVYNQRPVIAEKTAAAFPSVFRLLNNKWYVDEIYDVFIIRPLRGIGRLCWTIDDWGIDGIIWIVTAVPRAIAWILQQVFQRGALQGYALSGALAIAIILAIVLAKM